DFRHQVLGHVNGKTPPPRSAVQDPTRVLFAGLTCLAVRANARSTTQTERAENCRKRPFGVRSDHRELGPRTPLACSVTPQFLTQCQDGRDVPITGVSMCSMAGFYATLTQSLHRLGRAVMARRPGQAPGPFAN